MYTLVIFLIQKLILEQIECELLQIRKPHLNQLFTRESNKYDLKKQKVNQLSYNLGQIFKEIPNQLFHQLRLHHFVYIVLSGECIQKSSWRYVPFYKTCEQKFVLPFHKFFVLKIRHSNCSINLMLKCVLI